MRYPQPGAGTAAPRCSRGGERQQCRQRLDRGGVSIAGAGLRSGAVCRCPAASPERWLHPCMQVSKGCSHAICHAMQGVADMPCPEGICPSYCSAYRAVLPPQCQHGTVHTPCRRLECRYGSYPQILQGEGPSGALGRISHRIASHRSHRVMAPPQPTAPRISSVCVPTHSMHHHICLPPPELAQLSCVPCIISAD